MAAATPHNGPALVAAWSSVRRPTRQPQSCVARVRRRTVSILWGRDHGRLPARSPSSACQGRPLSPDEVNAPAAHGKHTAPKSRQCHFWPAPSPHQTESAECRSGINKKTKRKLLPLVSGGWGGRDRPPPPLLVTSGVGLPSVYPVARGEPSARPTPASPPLPPIFRLPPNPPFEMPTLTRVHACDAAAAPRGSPPPPLVAHLASCRSWSMATAAAAARVKKKRQARATPTLTLPVGGGVSWRDGTRDRFVR